MFRIFWHLGAVVHGHMHRCMPTNIVIDLLGTPRAQVVLAHRYGRGDRQSVRPEPQRDELERLQARVAQRAGVPVLLERHEARRVGC